MAHPFADEIEVGAHLRVKNESHGGQAVRGDQCRKLRRVEAAIAIFVELNQPVRKLLHRDYILEGANLRIAQLALPGYGEVVHALGGAEFFEGRHQLLNLLTGASQNLGRVARNVRQYAWNGIVDSGLGPDRIFRWRDA